MKTSNSLMKRTYSYTYLIPGLIIFGVLYLLPSIISFYYSFMLYDGFKIYGFAGFDNFKSIFMDTNNNISFKNTIIFSIVSVTFRMVIGLLLALLVNRHHAVTNYLRATFFFPVILSSVAVGVAFTSILDPATGILNIFLRAVGLDALAAGWLVDPKLVIYSCAGVEVWRMSGFAMALFLAGLQGIPKELYEASDIDGANFWGKFAYITIPSLIPIIKINFILSVIGGLKVLDSVYVLTGGGPGNASQVISSVVLKNFSQGRYGEATAANLILFIMIGVVVIIFNRIISRKESEA